MTWRTGCSGGCVFVDEGWCSFVGRSTESQLGNGWLACVHPKDRAGFVARLHQSRDSRVSFFCGYRLRHHSGDYLEVRARANPWIVDGQFRGHYGAVSERSTGTPPEETGHLLTFRAKQRRVALTHHGVENEAVMENA